MNESLIARRIRTLREQTNNGKNTISILQLDGRTEDVSFKFEVPATQNEINTLKVFNLPDDYIEFFTYTNGLSLFNTEIEGISMGYACEMYSIDQVITQYKKRSNVNNELLPILYLRDIGDMYINVDRFHKGESYLTFPGMESNKYFSYSVSEWLDKYVVSGGNEFWNQ